MAQAAGTDDGAYVGQGAFEFVVDHAVIGFFALGDFALGLAHAAVDGLFVVQGPVFESLAQGFDGWGQDEDRAGGGVEFADLFGTLPVYLEDYVEALFALIPRTQSRDVP